MILDAIHEIKEEVAKITAIEKELSELVKKL